MRIALLATIAVTLAAGCPSRKPAPVDPGGGGAARAARDAGAEDDRPPRGEDYYTSAVDAGSPADCVDHQLVGCREDECVAEAMDQGATEAEAQSECEMYCFCGL